MVNLRSKFACLLGLLLPSVVLSADSEAWKTRSIYFVSIFIRLVVSESTLAHKFAGSHRQICKNFEFQHCRMQQSLVLLRWYMEGNGTKA